MGFREVAMEEVKEVLCVPVETEGPPDPSTFAPLDISSEQV